MDCLARFRLKPRIDAAAFASVLGRFGRVTITGPENLKFESMQGPDTDVGVLYFADGFCTWEFDDEFDVTTNFIYVLAHLLRLVAIAETFFDEALCEWWAIGVNPSSNEYQEGSYEWFSACAAFRNPDAHCPKGFVEVDAVYIALDADRRLSVVGRIRPLTAEQIDYGQVISSLLSTYVNRRRDEFAKLEPILRERIERAIESQLKNFPL